MAGLNHSFFLVRRADFGPEERARFTARPGDVELPDDVLRYRLDTLRWRPAYDPARNEACVGLCMYGSTVLLAPGAALAAEVFSAWARLLGLGPAVLELTGAYSWVDDPAKGSHETLRFERDELCARLRALAAYGEQVALAGGELFLLHPGIGSLAPAPFTQEQPRWPK